MSDARLRIDLHLHTAGSWDSLSKPKAVLDRARAAGLDRIAITDHDTIAVALEWAGRMPDVVIPGEEVRTREGVDVIGLYLHTLIPRGTPAVETCEEIRRQGGVVYLPHPFARGKGGSGRLAELLVPYVDVVEVFNARLLSASRNARALELARRYDLLRGAGSDAHTVPEVGNAWVDLPAHANRADAFLAALREGSVGGRTASPLAFVNSNVAKLRKRMRFV